MGIRQPDKFEVRENPTHSVAFGGGRGAPPTRGLGKRQITQI